MRVLNTVGLFQEVQLFQLAHLPTPSTSNGIALARKPSVYRKFPGFWLKVIHRPLTGIHSIGVVNDLNIYPNPSQGVFNITINITGRKNLELEITNSLGQIVFIENLEHVSGSLTQQVDLEKCNAGIYSLRLITDEAVITRLIVIR